MAIVPDKMRKQIMSDRVEGLSYRQLADKYGMSYNGVRKLVMSDPKVLKRIEAKKEENTLSVLSFMDGRKHDVCYIIESLLGALSNPAKIASAPLDKIAVALGIVIDKFTVTETAQSDMAKENNLFTALDKASESVNIDDIPEIQ